MLLKRLDKATPSAHRKTRLCGGLAVLCAAAVLITVLLTAVVPLLQAAGTTLPYTPVVNFDTKLYTSKEAGSAGWTEGDGFGYTGKGLKWEPSVSVTRIYYSPTGNGAEEAFVFWMSGEDIPWSSPRDIQVYLHDTDGNRCFHLPKGATYYRVSDSGKQETVSVTMDKFVQLENGFSGWYVIPLSSLVVTWGPTLSDRPLNGSFCNVQLYNEWPAPNTIYLDELGFTADMAGFMAAVGGNASATITTTTTTPTTTTQPTPPAQAGAYTAVVDFDTKLYTSKDAGSAGWTEGVGFGQTGKGLKWEPSVSVSKLSFTPTGNGAEEAFVFWMSGEDIPWSSPRDIQLYLYDVDGNRCFHLPKGATYHRVSDSGKQETVSVALDKFVQLENGFSGWYVIPLSSLVVTWGPALSDRPLSGGFCGVQLYNEWPAPNTIYLDELGFTADMAGFMATRTSSTTTTETTTTTTSTGTSTGATTTTTQPGGNDVVELWPGEQQGFYLAVNFDKLQPLSVTPGENARTAVVQSGGGYGHALLWQQDTGLGNTASKLVVDFAAGGRAGDTAIAFRMTTGSESPWFTPHLYEAVNGEDCFRLKDGEQTYYTVGDDGILQARQCSGRTFRISPDFSGWVVLPYGIFEYFWGADATQSMDVAGICSLSLFYNDGVHITTPLSIDQIGHTDRIDLLLAALCGEGDSDQGDGLFRPAVDFDHRSGRITFPSSDNRAGTGEKVATSPSPYGMAYKWSRPQAEGTMSELDVMFNANGETTDEGFAFWVSMTQSGIMGTASFRTFLYDTESGTDCFKLPTGAIYYTIGKDGISNTHVVASDQHLDLPREFEGWVVLPFSSLTCFWSEGGDGEPDIPSITSLSLILDNAGFTGAIYLDNIGFVSQLTPFLTTYGELPKEDIPYVSFNSFDHLSDEDDGVGSAPGEGIEVWSDRAELAITGDWSEAYYGLYVLADEAATLHLQGAVEDPALVAGPGGVSFWMDTAQAVNITLALQTATGALRWETGDLRQDLYYLIDYNTGDVTAHPFEKAGVLCIPEGFCGFVAVSGTCFAADTDMATVKELQFRFDRPVELYLDSVSLFREVYTFITKGVNSLPDDDLLFAGAETVAVDNQNKVITLRAPMNSTTFRKAVAVRFGYRMVFADSKGAPLYGGVADMARIGYVDVYISADHAVTYTVQALYQPADSPATGQLPLWPLVLCGGMALVGVALLKRRKRV